MEDYKIKKCINESAQELSIRSTRFIQILSANRHLDISKEPGLINDVNILSKHFFGYIFGGGATGAVAVGFLSRRVAFYIHVPIVTSGFFIGSTIGTYMWMTRGVNSIMSSSSDSSIIADDLICPSMEKLRNCTTKSACVAGLEKDTFGRTLIEWMESCRHRRVKFSDDHAAVVDERHDEWPEWGGTAFDQEKFERE